MNNENALNGSVAVFALAAMMMAPGQAHALSLGLSSKPTLQNTVLTSPAIFTRNQDRPAKLIKVSRGSSKSPSLVSGLTSRLKKKQFSDIYFTKKTGSILEAEACKDNKRYFLQIAPDGEILQATKFDSCISPKIKSNAVSELDQEAATPVSIEEDPAPKIQKKTVPRAQQKPLVLAPKAKPRKTVILMDSQSLLAKQGYRHIYAPRSSYSGIMACKDGIEYAFNTARKVVSWQVLRAKRKALGKCFGYGKQILSKKDLLTIMRRHGDTEIRVVRETLPLFEAYSCLKGQRRHVKINRWGNDNIRKVGKCS